MNCKNNLKGFTLIETLVVLSIFTLAVILVGSFVVQGFKINRFTMEQGDAISYAQKGIDIMVKEIREASPSENGSYPITLALDQSITFYSDIDADEMVEQVRYYLDGTDLKKATINPSGFPPVYTGEETVSTISRYVRNNPDPIFYYYNGDFPGDEENNPLTTPAPTNEIRLVRVFLKVNVDPEKAPEHFILISNSQLRNLKNNL